MLPYAADAFNRSEEAHNSTMWPLLYFHGGPGCSVLLEDPVIVGVNFSGAPKEATQVGAVACSMQQLSSTARQQPRHGRMCLQLLPSHEATVCPACICVCGDNQYCCPAVPARRSWFLVAGCVPRCDEGASATTIPPWE